MRSIAAVIVITWIAYCANAAKAEELISLDKVLEVISKNIKPPQPSEIIQLRIDEVTAKIKSEVYIYNSATVSMKVALMGSDGSQSLVIFKPHERANFSDLSAVKICTRNHTPCRQTNVEPGHRYSIVPDYVRKEWLLAKLPE